MREEERKEERGEGKREERGGEESQEFEETIIYLEPGGEMFPGLETERLS